MQEHPVPQNVTGYEFHLIGQMTLKQFMEVAAGILVAVIINLTNLPQFVKYPLMGIAGLTGAALAFIPLEGRPLDRWFFAFIRSIYQPTMFFWKKTNTTPPALTYTQPQHLDTTPTVDYAPIRKARVQEFVATVQPITTEKDEESSRADAILALFSAPTPIPTPKPSTPSPLASSAPPIVQNTGPVGRILSMQEEGILSPTPVSQKTISSLPTPGGVAATINPVGYQAHPGSDLAAEQNNPPTVSSVSERTLFEAAPQRHQATTVLTTKPVVTSAAIPFPGRPKEPNMIAGMVFSNEQKILDNTIVTILKKADGTPVRALKTNQLGQFSVVTPLENGSYIISVEKEGYRFDNYSLILDNRVVDPIVITAT